MSFTFDRRDKHSTVVDLSSKLKRREFDAKHRWTPTKEDLDRIASDIWPETNGTRDAKTVKGKQPKKPPLTREAKRALSEIQSKAGSIGYEIQSLSEPALKGLAFEARQLAALYPEEPCLWRGIADECDRRREILARYRSGKGVWYAVVEIFQEEGPFSSRSVDLKFEKCIGKQSAIEAARKLLAENASRFSDEFSVQASIHCDLEWMPPND